MNVWIEVNRAALRHNFRVAQTLAGDAKIIAVIKANAYGHGAVECARVFSDAGAAMLAVTRLDEAIPIRDAGIAAPILLLAPLATDEYDGAVSLDLTFCVGCFDDALRLNDAAKKQDVVARAHLKINTGMGRLGIEPQECVATARRILELPNIALGAAWTHFAFASEPDAAPTRKQLALFSGARESLKTLVPQFHCANSSALLRFPDSRFSFARPGTMLYGQFPSASASAAAREKNIHLADTWKARARVVALRDLKVGQSVGYGGEWRATKPSRIATIAIGFADGLSQQPETREVSAFATLRNAAKNFARRGRISFRTVQFPSPDGRQSAPIVGRIAMQSCSVDVTGMPVQIGDVFDVSLRRTSAGAHLPRVYSDQED